MKKGLVFGVLFIIILYGIYFAYASVESSDVATVNAIYTKLRAIDSCPNCNVTVPSDITGSEDEAATIAAVNAAIASVNCFESQCIWKFNVNYACGTSSASSINATVEACGNPEDYTLNDWQLESSSGYPVTCEYNFYINSSSCANEGECSSPPSAPSNPSNYNDCVCQPWYCVQADQWGPGSSCLPAGSPSSTVEACMSMADIMMYGGWNSCFDFGSGTVELTENSGPYPTSACGGNC